MRSPPLGAVRKSNAAEAAYRRNKRKEWIVLVTAAVIALSLAVGATLLSPLARPACDLAAFDPHLRGKPYACPSEPEMVEPVDG